MSVAVDSLCSIFSRNLIELSRVDVIHFPTFTITDRAKPFNNSAQSIETTSLKLNKISFLLKATKCKYIPALP